MNRDFSFGYYFNVLAQMVFFPNLKIKPKQKWVKAIEDIGQVHRLRVQRDGKVVSAVKISRTSEPQGVVVLGHPISKKAKFFFGEKSRISFYLERGFDVVAFDFNGFGESDRIDLRYWKDAQAVVQHLRQEYNNHRFVLHGVSFGSFHVLRAYKDLPKNSVVVLENMSRSLYDYWKRWLHTRLIIRFLEKLPIQAFQEMEVIEQFKTWDRPDITIMAIASEKDIYTPADEMKDAISYLRQRNHFVLLPNATHLQGPYEQSDLYRLSLNRALNPSQNKIMFYESAQP